jgi:hypothetical protein
VNRVPLTLALLVLGILAGACEKPQPPPSAAEASRKASAMQRVQANQRATDKIERSRAEARQASWWASQKIGQEARERGVTAVDGTSPSNKPLRTSG